MGSVVSTQRDVSDVVEQPTAFVILGREMEFHGIGHVEGITAA